MVIAQANMLERLWSLAEKEAARASIEPDYVFDPIGLILVRPMRNMGYESTPINSITFAETGGDGVHFSLVQLHDVVSEDSPVVMTVPMQPDKPNIVVGSNLFEFLCLGSQIGYFPLEQLVYDQRTTIRWIRDPRVYFEQEYGTDVSELAELLNLLAVEFNLRSWDSVEQHLNDLQTQYLPLLQLRTSQ